MDSYGTNGAQQIRTLAQRNDICIAINTPIPNVSVQSEWDRIIHDLRASPRITVAVVFSLSVSAVDLLTAINNGNLTRRITFIGSDDVRIEHSSLGRVAHGSLFIQVHSQPNDDFRNHWNQLENGKFKTSPWYSDFNNYWKERHNCTSMTTCPYPPVSESTVINGVLAFAHALHATIPPSCHTGFNCNTTLNGQILTNNLRKVSFPTDSVGDIFKFDINGEAAGKYDILNLQKQDGQYILQEIGKWDQNGFSDFQKDIQWGPVEETNNETPVSICKETCKPGYIEIYIEKRCCTGCRPCPNNSIVVNLTKCQECPLKQWPNEDFTICEPLKPNHLAYYEPGIIIIVIASSIGLLLTLHVAFGIFIYRNERLIKATSRELSVIIICGLFLSFLTPFMKSSPVTNASCMISEIFTSFSFLLIFGPTSLKVIRIYRIFTIGRKSANRLKLVLPADQILLLLVLITIQVNLMLYHFSLYFYIHCR